MPNHMKFCGCDGCKRGMHSGKHSSFMMKKVVRKLRHKTKDALRKGDEPPHAISVPYTD